MDKRHKETFFPDEDVQMANRHTKRCPASLAVSEMKSKPTMGVLCPEFVIPKDRQGAESNVKAKEPLFELARAQSPTCTYAAVRYRGERASFKRTKVLLGPRGSWWGNGCGLSRLAGEGLESFRQVSGRLLKGRRRGQGEGHRTRWSQPA